MKEREKDDKTGSRRRDGQRERAKVKREKRERERGGEMEGRREREGGRERLPLPLRSPSYSPTHNRNTYRIQHTEEQEHVHSLGYTHTQFTIHLST